MSFRQKETARDRVIMDVAEKRPELLEQQEWILTRPANLLLAAVCALFRHPWSSWHAFRREGVEMAWCRRCDAQKLRLRPEDRNAEKV